MIFFLHTLGAVRAPGSHNLKELEDLHKTVGRVASGKSESIPLKFVMLVTLSLLFHFSTRAYAPPIEKEGKHHLNLTQL